MEVIIGILIVVIIVLSIFLFRKQHIDKTELNEYQKELVSLKVEDNSLKNAINSARKCLQNIQNETHQAQLDYYDAASKKIEDLDDYFAEQRQKRQQKFDEESAAQQNLYKAQEEVLQLQLEQTLQNCDKEAELAKEALANLIDDCSIKAEQYKKDAAYQQQKFESLLAPLQQYEMDKMQRLFYTVQVPEGYHEDIDFLLNTVSKKVQHPDVINKLVWTEYVRPYLTDAFNRIGIKEEPGIYKLTNVNSGKPYIGKSTNVKKRITDHFKASIGLESIAWQAVHDEILREGIWNWTIEVITYCDKDQLSELEKYYIEFFQTQSFGYNKKMGG